MYPRKECLSTSVVYGNTRVFITNLTVLKGAVRAARDYAVHVGHSERVNRAKMKLSSLIILNLKLVQILS